MDILKKLIEYVRNYRCDASFDNILECAENLITEQDIDITPVFKDTRLTRRKRQFDYECVDETSTNPKFNYKLNFFLPILDTTIQSLQDRFEMISEISGKFSFLNNFNKIFEMDAETLKSHCMDLEIVLTDRDSKDISESELLNEILIFNDLPT